MKTVITVSLLIFIIGNITAVDIDSYQFIDHLRTLSKPGKPEVFEDAVLFTAPSIYSKVGISFAHEDYGKVHWFKRLMIPRDPAERYVRGKLQKNISPNVDSGIMFHLEAIPANIKNMDYRVIIDGLWTVDPMNPISITRASGIVESRFPLPEKSKTYLDPPPSGAYRFTYQAAQGETITVGGSFNNWDPFMYELREISPGFYSLTLPLPPANFQYVFFHRGEQIPDPENARKLYTREGRIVSEGIIP